MTTAAAKTLAAYERRVIEGAVYFTVILQVSPGVREREEVSVNARRTRSAALARARRIAAEKGPRALVYAVDASNTSIYVDPKFVLSEE